MSRSAFTGPDMRSPEGRRGLTLRLTRKRNEAIGKSTLLPVYSVRQIPDKKASK